MTGPARVFVEPTGKCAADSGSKVQEPRRADGFCPQQPEVSVRSVTLSRAGTLQCAADGDRPRAGARTSVRFNVQAAETAEQSTRVDGGTVKRRERRAPYTIG